VSGVGARLIGAAKEARQIAKGEIKAAHTFIPADIDVKAVRQKTGMTQEDFAATFGFSTNQIKDWEQHRSRPLGALRAYLILIQSCPAQMAEMLSEALKSGDDERAA
jgi:putative transcriptional regulator